MNASPMKLLPILAALPLLAPMASGQGKVTLRDKNGAFEATVVSANEYLTIARKDSEESLAIIATKSLDEKSQAHLQKYMRRLLSQEIHVKLNLAKAAYTLRLLIPRGDYRADYRNLRFGATQVHFEGTTLVFIEGKAELEEEADRDLAISLKSAESEHYKLDKRKIAKVPFEGKNFKGFIIKSAYGGRTAYVTNGKVNIRVILLLGHSEINPDDFPAILDSFELKLNFYVD